MNPANQPNALACELAMRAGSQVGNPFWAGVVVSLSKKFRWVAGLAIGGILAVSLRAETITNLAELRLAAPERRPVFREIRIEAQVCSVSDSGREFVLQDDSGAEVVRVDMAPPVVPGDKILLTASNCRVRLESWGVSLSSPLIDCDGLHGAIEKSVSVDLAPGRVPLRLEWFNASMERAFKFFWRPPGGERGLIPAANLWWRDHSGVWSNGLAWSCYEGSWQELPEFANLPVVKKGISPEISPAVATRHDFVGLVFDGYLEVPRAGEYQFFLVSDDGARLFLGEVGLKISVLSGGKPPSPLPLKPGTTGEEFRWAESSGTVKQLWKHEDAVEVILNSPDGPVRVRIPGAETPALATETPVLVRGVALDVFHSDGARGFGILNVASALDVRTQSAASKDTNVLTSADEVARLSRAQASQSLPVCIRGVVICDSPQLYSGTVIHDRQRGIYCAWPATNAATGQPQRRPRFGEYWEFAGVTEPGSFAPDVRAARLTFLGEGELPPPISPAWDQLLSGSLDAQFVELQGIITDIHTNGVSLLTRGGKIRVNLDPPHGTAFQPRLNSLVRLRGCLLALWDEKSHEVKLGEIRLGNATATFDAQQPADPFDAPQKNVDDLLRFDVSAGSLQRVKVVGQITGKRGEEIFMLNNGRGLRFLPRVMAGFRPGELVEVAGFPELDGPSPVLHEAEARRTGFSQLPAPVRLKPTELFRPQNDGQLVRVDAVFNGLRATAGETLLDLQSGGNYFTARLRMPAATLPEIQPGSRVEVDGLFAALSAPGRIPGRHLGAFEILSASPDSVRVLAKPPWWTLRRLLAVTGVLTGILILAALWITQLRRRVEERTEQLRAEIAGRERSEQLRIVQEERTRIAQDLHDDLGSSLTEISVLASAGRRAPEDAAKANGVFGAISEKSHQLVSALDAIVWAIDPKENTLQSLADYLAGYVEDYLSTNGIACRFKLPEELPVAVVEGRQRHELFLAVKEALHNIVRHAGATEVEFHLAVAASCLEVVIRDNGRGFDATTKTGGHGLNNFSGRMARLNGECIVTSEVGGGTTIKLKLPLNV